MMHKKRRHRFIVFDDIDELVAHIKRANWVSCAGWIWRDLVMRNDQTSADGMFELNVCRDLGDGKLEDFESLTIPWIEADGLKAYLESYTRGPGKTPPEEWEKHGIGHMSGSCAHCA